MAAAAILDFHWEWKWISWLYIPTRGPCVPTFMPSRQLWRLTHMMSWQPSRIFNSHSKTPYVHIHVWTNWDTCSWHFYILNSCFSYDLCHGSHFENIVPQFCNGTVFRVSRRRISNPFLSQLLFWRNSLDQFFKMDNLLQKNNKKLLMQVLHWWVKFGNDLTNFAMAGRQTQMPHNRS